MGVYDFERLKQDVKVEDIVRHYHLKLVKEGALYKTLCIFHNEKTPSLTLYPDHFFCHGCQKRGDAVDFVMQMEGLKTQAEAIEKLAAISGLSSDQYKLPQDTQLPSSFRKFNRQGLPASVTDPGSVSTVRIPIPVQEQVKYGPWTHVKDYPYHETDGTVRYYIERIERHPLNGEGKKQKRFLHKWQHSDGAWVYGIKGGKYVKRASGEYRAFDESQDRPEDAVELPEVERILCDAHIINEANTVFLVEGEKDKDTLFFLGYQATTASGGCGSPWLPSFTWQLRGKNVIHIPDNDPDLTGRNGEPIPGPGKVFAAKVKEAIESQVASYRQIVTLGPHKDITDYLDAVGDDPDTRREAFENLLGSPEQLAIEEHERIVEQERLKQELRNAGFISPVAIVSLFDGGEEAFLDYTKRPPGIPTGFKAFDQMTMGLTTGLHILAARPGVGKTGFAMDVARNVAGDGRGVAISSLEMSDISLLDRMLCNVASVDSLRFRAGHLDPAEKHRLGKAWRRIQVLPLYIDSTSLVHTDYLFEKYLKLREEHDLSLAIIDYLQLMQGVPKKGFENRVQEISSMTRALKLMSKELNVPFLVLSQLSRDPEKRTGDHRPQLADLRESGSIEQDADSVSFLYREELYRPDKEELKGKAELIIGKQRNGPTGRIRLRFCPQFTRFENVNDFDSIDPEQYRDSYENE